MLDQKFADRFALEWLEAWNAHDLDAIMAHYSTDVVFQSPMTERVLGDPSGIVQGADALRDYFARGLAAVPDLSFELKQVLTGAHSVTLYYRSSLGADVAELMQLDGQGRAVLAMVHYRRG
jgi:ketosteroid isomerase-like protein